MNESLKAESSPNPTTSTLSNDLINKLNKIFSNEETSVTSNQLQTNDECPKMTSSQNLDTNESNKTDSNSNILHKLLAKKNEEQFKILIDYFKKRLENENGEIIVTIGQHQETEAEQNGISQNEMNTSVDNLMALGKELNVEITQLREKTINPTNKKTQNDEDKEQTSKQAVESRFVRDYLIRKALTDTEDFIEVRVAVVGNVDSGKSTLLGVLTHSILDDGRGEARCKLFRHKHEIETGRTSSVGNDILGFDASGRVMNDEVVQHHPTAAGSSIAARHNLEWEEICKRSSKVLTFIDLAGHEKYLKTTVFGMTGLAPDFCMLMIGSNMGIIGMTKEHLGLSLALNVPVFVVITKIDICPSNVLQDTINILVKILKSPGCRKLPYLVENQDDVVTCALNFTSERLCPIFQVSNVTGKNLNLLKSFLNLLNSRMDIQPQGPSEFQIDDLYSVPGVGTVVSGTCYKGRIQLNDTVWLGPDLIGQFRPVVIKGIHRKRLPVKEVRSGQTASFALKKIKRSELRKGMVMLSDKTDAVASWAFEAEILVLHHPTTISVNYQAMVHCNSIRQTATILEMSVEHLRTGEKATVKFSFLKNPEYLRVGAKMIFREGRTKAVGTITKVNLQVPTKK